MKYIKKIASLFLIFGFLSFTQIPEELTSIRPKYSPDTIGHRNKLDDFGNKWGNWQYYSKKWCLDFRNQLQKQQTKWRVCSI